MPELDQDANNPGRPMPLMVAADEDKGGTRVVFIRKVFAFVPVADRAAELNHYVRLQRENDGRTAHRR